jgi:adenylosuccinate lyase
MSAWEERRPFLEILKADPEVASRLSEERLAACFDLKAALANSGRVFDALDSPEPDLYD